MEYAIIGGVSALVSTIMWGWGYYTGYKHAMEYATTEIDTLRSH